MCLHTNPIIIHEMVRKVRHIESVFVRKCEVFYVMYLWSAQMKSKSFGRVWIEIATHKQTVGPKYIHTSRAYENQHARLHVNWTHCHNKNTRKKLFFANGNFMQNPTQAVSYLYVI